MKFHREKERFAVIAETDFDKALLTALMGTLPYKAEGKGYIYFHDYYYQPVMNFINDIEEKFNDALCDLSEEVRNEV